MRRIATPLLIIVSGASCATSLPNFRRFQEWAIKGKRACCVTSDQFTKSLKRVLKNSRLSLAGKLQPRLWNILRVSARWLKERTRRELRNSMNYELAHLPRHIFISYSTEDRAFADRLASSLRHDGLQAWIDDEGIEPGTANWESTIRKAVRDSYAVALVCSPNTIASQYIAAELRLAERNNRQVVPVWASGDHWTD